MNSGVTTAASSGSGTACSASACCACSRRLLLLFLPILLLLLPILLLPMSIAAFDATVAVLGDIPLPSRSEQKKNIANNNNTALQYNNLQSIPLAEQSTKHYTIKERTLHTPSRGCTNPASSVGIFPFPSMFPCVLSMYY